MGRTPLVMSLYYMYGEIFLVNNLHKTQLPRPNRPFALVDHKINFWSTRWRFAFEKFEKQLLPPSHSWIVSQTNPCKFRKFQTVVKYFLSITELKFPFNSQQAIWALKCVRKRLNDSNIISRICTENHSRVTGWHGGHCNPYSWDIAWKFIRYQMLMCSFSSCWQNFSKSNCFRVYRKLITWSTKAKGLSTFLIRCRFLNRSTSSLMKA